MKRITALKWYILCVIEHVKPSLCWSFQQKHFVFRIFMVYRILHIDGMQCTAYAQSGFFFLITENRSTEVKMLYLAYSVGSQTVLSLKTLMCMWISFMMEVWKCCCISVKVTFCSLGRKFSNARCAALGRNAVLLHLQFLQFDVVTMLTVLNYFKEVQNYKLLTELE